MDLFLTIAPLKWGAIFTVLTCGAIIGVERQLSGKPAGIRTSCLISLGTYIFVASGLGLTGGQADPARVIGQVVTGIGFLGAGVMMARDGAVIGVTSAATIWVLAAIAVQAGLDHYWAAIVLSLLTVGILVGVSWLENTFINLQSGVHSPFASLRRRNDRRGDRRASEEPRE